MRSIKVAQIGCGKMSKFIMKYIQQKGGKVVCAFDVASDKIGVDICSVYGGKETGVCIEDVKNLEKSLKRHKPDIAIVTTMSLLREIEDVVTVCVKNSVNVITTCEEAFYPFNSAIKIAKRLDSLAKENGCTICGSGYQDYAWGSFVSSLCGSTQSIKRIRGLSSYNVEDYGIALARVHGAGLDVQTFNNEIASVDNISDEARQKLIKKGEYAPSYMWTVNGWLCDKLGLTVEKQTQKCRPQTHKKDLKSSTLGMVIKKGFCTGMSAIVTTTTREGVVIESECIGKVYAPNETDLNEWTVEGEPNTSIKINSPNTAELTCGAIVNRLIDVIQAQPGFVTTNNMPDLHFVNKLTI